MTWEVTADALAFEEAVSWFRARVPLSDAAFYALTAEARRRAFTIAAVATLDLVAETQDSLDRALAEGLSFADWKSEIADRLVAAWAESPDGPADPAWRLETIFRTNAQMAYSTGRFHQLDDPAVRRARPFRLYDAILDARTTEACRGFNGTTLPADDPWWDTHWPPVHFNCRSGVRSLRASQAEARGITQVPPGDAGQPGFGLTPTEREWQPNAADYDPALWREYRARTERDE